MQLDAVFHRKEPQFEPKACVAERIIELDPQEFAYFLRNMQRDHDFIAENNDTIRVDGDGTAHCLLVVAEGRDDGVLVNSEGSGYARRAAFVPGARQLLMAEEQRAEQAFTEQIGGVPGADLSLAPTWMVHARARAEADSGTSGAAAHHDYLRRL